MQEAFKNAKGQLRKKLGAKPGQPIPESKLEAATASRNLKTKRRAVLAETARRVAQKHVVKAS